MRENGFSEKSWETGSVGDLLRTLPRRPIVTATSSDTVAESVKRMKEHGISQLPVLDDGKVVGIVTESDLLEKLVDGRASLTSAVAEVMFRRVTTVRTSDDAVGLLALFAKGMVGLVLDDAGALAGVVTKMDLVDVLTARVDKAL
jgi:cystathionine beta-synthase